MVYSYTMTKLPMPSNFVVITHSISVESPEKSEEYCLKQTLVFCISTNPLPVFTTILYNLQYAPTEATDSIVSSNPILSRLHQYKFKMRNWLHWGTQNR